MKSFSWSKFFRIIWRVNALAIFILVLVAVGGLSITSISGFFRSSRNFHQVSPDLAPQEAGKPELRLGQFTRIGSTNVLRAELRELEEGSFSIKGARSIAHNVLFVDSSDGRSWWLLPDSNSSISEEHEISVTKNNIEIPLGKVYLIDSPHKSGENQSTIVLSDTKGQKQVVVAKGAVLIDDLLSFSAEEAKLIYHDPSGYRITVIQPTETRLIRDIRVPIAFPPRQ